ncbi:DNA cytosine methyltransferase, partial [Cutibacterium granulosum]
MDLFSGAGGLSLGLEDAGWTVAASVDHYAAALETHAANFGGLTLDWDLGGQEVRDRFVGLFKDTKVDLVAGGPPCQPFSQAGRSKIRHLVEHHGRSAEDPRRELWRAFADIAIRLEPRAILMENVPNMGLGDDFLVLRTLAEQLQSRGYEVRVTLASAREHGVPQRRRRMILLARNDGFEIQWPTSKPEVPLRDAIGDLPNLHGGTGARQMRYAPSSRSGYSELMRGRIPETEEHLIHDHYTRPVREDDRRIFESM